MLFRSTPSPTNDFMIRVQNTMVRSNYAPATFAGSLYPEESCMARCNNTPTCAAVICRSFGSDAIVNMYHQTNHTSNNSYGEFWLQLIGGDAANLYGMTGFNSLFADSIVYLRHSAWAFLNNWVLYYQAWCTDIASNTASMEADAITVGDFATAQAMCENTEIGRAHV